MKISLALSAFILAAGIGFGLLHQQQLTSLRKDRDELLVRAKQSGIRIPESGRGEPKITKRQREDRDAQARSMSSELMAYAKEMEFREKNGGDADEAFQKRGLEVLQRLMALDSEQLQTVITGLRDDKDLSEESRRNMIGFSIMMLAEDHPSAALALYSATSDLLGGSDMGQQVINSSLGKWAKDDPSAALKWLDENSKNHPELTGEDARSSVLSGLAENDPKTAFQMLGRLGLHETSGAVQSIVEAAKNPEQRTAVLGAFRDYLATVQDSDERDALREEALGGLARGINGESFDDVTSWISKQKLTPEENDMFTTGISYDTTKADTGRWIDWMAGTLPREKIGERVGDLIGQWTQQDYIAAGQWLSAAPEGPAKAAAVRSYAETVAEYDPRTAAQWAMTLPDGDERRETLKSIHENWPKNDAAAGEAFAREHGLPIAEP